MTREQILKRFPNASESTLKRNGMIPDFSGDSIEPEVAARLRARDPDGLIFPKGITMSTDEEKLNKLERAFLSYLRTLHPGEWIGIQNITLKLADDCRYTCDFWTYHGGGLQGWEVKGFRREDSWIKLKVAARTYAAAGFRFTLVERVKGEWKFTEVKP